MKRICLLLCVFAIFGLFAPFSTPSAASANADELFDFTLSTLSCQPDEELLLTVSVNPEIVEATPAGFRFTATFDSENLVFKRIVPASNMQNNAFRYHVKGDTIIGIYVCDGLSAPQLTDTILTVVFQVSKETAFGKTTVSSSIDQVIDFDTHPIPADTYFSDTVTIQPPFEYEALLTMLEPDNGTLIPAFDPHIQEYTMQVDAMVSQIQFDMQATDGGTTRVNRKNLGKQGSVTQFVITVISADQKHKSQYTVDVTRGEKVASNSTSSSKTTGKTISSGSRVTGQTDEAMQDETGTIYTAGTRNLYIQSGAIPTYLLYIIAIGVCALLCGAIVIIVLLTQGKRGKH